MMRTGAPGERW